MKKIVSNGRYYQNSKFKFKVIMCFIMVSLFYYPTIFVKYILQGTNEWVLTRSVHFLARHQCPMDNVQYFLCCVTTTYPRLITLYLYFQSWIDSSINFYFLFLGFNKWNYIWCCFLLFGFSCFSPNIWLPALFSVPCIDFFFF